jgi:hypothetical protein
MLVPGQAAALCGCFKTFTANLVSPVRCGPQHPLHNTQSQGGGGHATVQFDGPG